LQTFNQTLRSGSVTALAVNKLDDQMKAYRNKHMEDFDNVQNDH
jgi:hypothetical protein